MTYSLVSCINFYFFQFSEPRWPPNHHWTFSVSAGSWPTTGKSLALPVALGKLRRFSEFLGKTHLNSKKTTAPSSVFDRKKGIATVFFFCCHDSQGYEGGERRDVNRAVKATSMLVSGRVYTTNTYVQKKTTLKQVSKNPQLSSVCNNN